MNSREAGVLFAAYFALWMVFNAAVVVALNDEGHALLEFGSRVKDFRGSLSNWDPDHATPCEWTGVTCSEDSRVVFINLTGKGLGGNLTLDISRFTELRALNLSSNAFVGEIPSSFVDSPSLSILNLHSNNLTGAIPSAISRLTNLTHLDLSDNHLQGEIPVSLTNLPNLSFLNVSFNDFKGSVAARGSVGNVGISTSQDCERARFLVETGVSSVAESSTKGGKKGLSVGSIVAICVCAFLVSKFFLGTLCYFRWKKMHATCEVKLSGGKMVMFQLSGKATPSSKEVLQKVQMLKPKDIIGSGGYGTVYKLALDDKSTFAIKKLARGGLDGDRGFERELETLADIKHRNLVALRGYYSAPEINILVYDLMPNGNLDSFLHDRVKRGEKPLSWDIRLNIAIGAARGLSYLHHDCIPHIIHRDIKTSNILLDEDLEARVSDFGLAKLINPLQTHVTTVVAGTLGYLPPEYLETGKITEKGDVYSFGVVLLELLTGKRPTDCLYMDNDLNMVQWAKNMVDEEHPEDVFDEYILGTCPDEDLLTALDIAFQCVNQASARPSMPQVLKMLEKLHPDMCCTASCLRFSSQLTSSQSGLSSGTSTISSAPLSL